MAKLIDITGRPLSGEWGKDDENGDGIPVLRTTNFTNEGVVNYDNVVTRTITKKNIDDKFLRKGDIIIEKSGGSDKFPVGRVIYFNGDENTYLFNNFTGLLRVKDKELWYPKYVFYSLYANYKRGGTRIYENKTTGLHNLKTDDYVSRYEIKEIDMVSQISICEKLDMMRKIVKFRKRELQLLDELVRSRFVELFGNENKRVTISSVCDVSGGYSFKSGDISSNGVVKIVQIGNVYLDDLKWETTNYLPEGFDYAYSRFLLNEGDVVIALTRPIIQALGNVKACIVKESDMPCLLNQRVGRIVPKQNVDVSMKFVYRCLMTDDFTRYVESCCIGCSQPNISTKDIENYMIPDISYAEQMAFVKFIEQIDKSKFRGLSMLTTMKSAYEQQAFIYP